MLRLEQTSVMQRLFVQFEYANGRQKGQYKQQWCNLFEYGWAIKWVNRSIYRISRQRNSTIVAVPDYHFHYLQLRAHFKINARNNSRNEGELILLFVSLLNVFCFTVNVGYSKLSSIFDDNYINLIL